MSKSNLLTKCTCNLARFALKLADIFKPHTTALIDLALRIWIALVFWKSGVIKIANWDVTLILFKEEHPVPGLSPEMAAYLGTFNELVMPILLVIGLGARFAAIALLVSTAIIQFTYLNSHEHFIWALVLGAIMIRGAGLYSLDFFVRQKHGSNPDASVGKFSRYIAFSIVSMLNVIALHEIIAIVFESVDPWLGDLLSWWQSLGALA